MNILIVGSGGREHALAWSLAKSDRIGKLFCAPGNAGTQMLADNVPIDAEDIPSLMNFAGENGVQLTVVGPEDPLCAGIVDRFTEAGLRIFGPAAGAARLEGDKAFAKQLMKQTSIPTAEGRIFDNYDQAREYAASRDTGLVVKAAGLAKGKGVMVCAEPADALLALERIMVKQIFGSAGSKVVVEEKLSGPELSIQALVDGHTIYLLEPAQDYKPLGEGDTGPNTGGMGAYCPAETLSPAQLHEVYGQILVPVVDALNRQGAVYRGLLYAGLMLTAAGPKVLEFNCRFGDPETQAVLPRLQTDFVDVLEAVVEQRLDSITLDWDPRACTSVVLASAGYPAEYPKGKFIHGLDAVESMTDVQVFHAGTLRRGDHYATNGGRVLSVSALGESVADSRRRAYDAIGLISFDGAYCRRDIAEGVAGC